MARRKEKRKAAVAPANFLPGPLMTEWRKWLPQVLLICGLTFWIYWPALWGGFVWDDSWYIPTNPMLHNLTGLWQFWFQPGAWGEYYPVHETLLWIEWQIWGDAPLGYHLTGIVLHLVSAFLVWHLLSKFRLRLAWLGGLLFAVHPAQVESVAWISELKNAVSLPFFLLSMSAWIDYEEHRRKEDYQWALLWFLIAMLGKVTMAPFPAIILLYAWWKRGRVDWQDLRASAPFFIISLVLSAVTIWSERHYAGTVSGPHDIASLGGFFSRLAGSGLILSFYFSRALMPVDYFPVYPKWPVNPASLEDYLPWLVVVGVIFWLWRRRHGWGRHALLGLGFFFLLLTPFLGFIASGYMDFTWAMDHFLYIPIIGLIGLVIAALDDLETRFSRSRVFVRVFFALGVILMSFESHAAAGWFFDDETLWARVLLRSPDSWIAHQNLGFDLITRQHYQEALDQFTQVQKLHPGTNDGGVNLANALEKVGQTEAAEDQYRELLRLFPDDPRAYWSLGELKNKAGHSGEAEALFRQGLKVAPNDPTLYIDLAGLLLQTGRQPEAIDLYEHAAELSPDLPQLQYDLGVAQLQAGNLSGAEDHLEQALTLDHNLTAAHDNLGVIFARTGRLPEAIDQFAAVLQVNPNSPQTLDNLALALAQTGQIPAAIEKFTKALELNPQDARARDSLAKLKQYEQKQAMPGKN